MLVFLIFQLRGFDYLLLIMLLFFYLEMAWFWNLFVNLSGGVISFLVCDFCSGLSGWVRWPEKEGGRFIFLNWRSC